MSALYIAVVQWVPCSELRLRDATASKEVGTPHLLFGFGNVVLGENLCICFFLYEEERQNLLSSS